MMEEEKKIEEKDEGIKKEFEPVELKRVELDFDKISEWRSDRLTDCLPACCMLDFYRAIDLWVDFVQYSSDNNGVQVISVENLACNFNTMRKIKNFVKSRWQKFPINIKSDYGTFWDTRLGAKYKPYKRPHNKLNKTIEASLAFDFANYCPGLDDSLPDNVIVFKTREIKAEDNIGQLPLPKC